MAVIGLGRGAQLLKAGEPKANRLRRRPTIKYGHPTTYGQSGHADRRRRVTRFARLSR